jgi:hypothetical protein
MSSHVGQVSPVKPQNKQDSKPKGVRKTVLCDDFYEKEAVT